MAQQTINIGTVANDGTGDTIRDGGDKINDNFDELYAADAALDTRVDALEAGGGGGGIYDANWFDVMAAPYSATGDGSTDDTAAIQAAIDDCEAAGGGVVYFPEGIYVVNGALQDTSRSNAQLLLPRRDMSGTPVVPVTIELRGERPPPFVPYVITESGIPTPTQGSIIKGTLNTASGTAPCLIGAWGPSGSFNDLSMVHIVMRDLTVRMPANPQLSAVDLSHVNTCEIDNVVIDTGDYYVPGLAQMTTAASHAFKSPRDNNGGRVTIGTLGILGFYNGCTVEEHFNATALSVMGCRNALVYKLAYHCSWMGRVLVQHCQNVLVFDEGQHYTRIEALNIEHADTGTWVTTYDINDASNYAQGSINYHVVLANTGPVSTFTKNGATNIVAAPLNLGTAITQTTGSWTPTVSFGGASTGVTYTTQLGRYVRTGNLVTATCHILLSSRGSSTGNFALAGLPFTSRNLTNYLQAGSVGFFSTGIASKAFNVFLNPNVTTLTFADLADASIATHADVANTSQIVVTITYECEP